MRRLPDRKLQIPLLRNEDGVNHTTARKKKGGSTALTMMGNTYPHDIFNSKPMFKADNIRMKLATWMMLHEFCRNHTLLSDHTKYVLEYTTAAYLIYIRTRVRAYIYKV